MGVTNHLLYNWYDYPNRGNDGIFSVSTSWNILGSIASMVATARLGQLIWSTWTTSSAGARCQEDAMISRITPEEGKG